MEGGTKIKGQFYLNIYRQKNINITFLQETHSDQIDEIDWRMWWEGNIFFSHGSNLSESIAILFGKNIKMTVVSTCEIEKGRALALQVEIMGLLFVFINIYAPNNETERIRIFGKVNDSLKGFDKDAVLVLGGDWNCTLDLTLDRNGEEPCPPSVTVLSNIIRDYDLIDVWREHHPI